VPDVSKPVSSTASFTAALRSRFNFRDFEQDTLTWFGEMSELQPGCERRGAKFELFE
jgi:hypothetical protein